MRQARSSRCLAKDPTDSYESALKDFYRKIRPGEPATLSNARSAIMRLFFDPKRYNLGRVGRYKLNSKLGFEVNDETLQTVTLTKEDVIGALKVPDPPQSRAMKMLMSMISTTWAIAASVLSGS